MTVASNLADLALILVVLVVEALSGERLAHPKNEVVHLGDGHRQVVFVDFATVCGRLRNRLAKSPELGELTTTLSEKTVRDDLGFQEVLEERLELGVVVLTIRASRLDDDVEGGLLLERFPSDLANGVLLDELIARGVEEFKGRKDLADVALGRLEACLDGLE